MSHSHVYADYDSLETDDRAQYHEHVERLSKLTVVQLQGHVQCLSWNLKHRTCSLVFAQALYDCFHAKRRQVSAYV